MTFSELNILFVEADFNAESHCFKYKLNNGKTVQSDKDIASWEKAKELNSLFKKYKNENLNL